MKKRILLPIIFVVLFVPFYLSWPKEIGWKKELLGTIWHWKALLLTKANPRYYQCLDTARGLEGMTREELVEIAYPDGGLGPAYNPETFIYKGPTYPPITYIFKGCRFPQGALKIDVEFEPANQNGPLFSPGAGRGYWGQDDDVANRVSEPYLAYPCAD